MFRIYASKVNKQERWDLYNKKMSNMFFFTNVCNKEEALHIADDLDKHNKACFVLQDLGDGRHKVIYDNRDFKDNPNPIDS